MTELLRDNLVLAGVVALVVAIVLYLLLRPGQRVQLSDNVPLRPHMTIKADSQREGNGLAAEAAAAAGDVTGQVIGTQGHAQLGGDTADDFQRMKGVGPKFAQMLQARGFFRFDQIANLTPQEVTRLEPHLGPFQGRIARDRIVEQALYLARADEDGFEANFGKL